MQNLIPVQSREMQSYVKKLRWDLQATKDEDYFLFLTLSSTSSFMQAHNFDITLGNGASS